MISNMMCLGQQKNNIIIEVTASHNNAWKDVIITSTSDKLLEPNDSYGFSAKDISITGYVDGIAQGDESHQTIIDISIRIKAYWKLSEQQHPSKIKWKTQNKDGVLTYSETRAGKMRYSNKLFEQPNIFGCGDKNKKYIIEIEPVFE